MALTLKPTPLALAVDVFERRLNALPGHAGLMLRAEFASLEDRLREQGGFEGLFQGPEGSPAFVLLSWLADGLGAEQQDREQASLAMLVLYLAVRIQDDIVDEGGALTGVYLQQLLTGWAMGLCSQSSAGTERWIEVMARFADAAIQDQSWRSLSLPWTQAATRLQGAKYLPMALPLMWLAERCGRAQLCGPIAELVEALGVPLQLTNDLLGAERDLLEGQRSSYLAVLGLDPRRHHVDDILPSERRSWQDGSLREHLESIDLGLVQGQEIASNLALGGALETHLEQRRVALRGRRLRLSARHAFGGRSLTLDIELTRRCNLRCPDCFVFAQEGDMSQLAELEPSLVMQVLEELSGYRGVLHLTGGEPFYYPAIWDVLEAADRLRMPSILINTNGGLLGEQELARLGALRADVHLLVSIDGPPGTHERVRGQSQTVKTLATLRDAHGHGVKASPASILTGDLLDFGIARWAEWIQERTGRSERLTLWPIFPAPLGTLNQRPTAGRALSPVDVERTARQCADLYHQGSGVTIADYPLVNPLMERYGIPASELWQCTAGTERLCVQADGQVSPCHPFRRELARVDASSVRGFVSRALRHEDARALGAREHLGCGSCEHQSVCGSCQAATVGRGLEFGGNDGGCQDILKVPPSPSDDGFSNQLSDPQTGVKHASREPN